MSRRTFSIVIPTHNRPALLSEAIRSVRSQTCDDWELIVVDDASEPKVLREAISDLAGRSVTLIRQERPMGGAASKSAGASLASGKYITFLDDDDCYAPKYLESALVAFMSNNDLDVAFVNVKWFGDRQEAGERAQREAMEKVLRDAGPQPGSGKVLQFAPGRLFTALLQRVPMPFQRIVSTAEQYRKVGGYNPDCLLWDCDWALRAALVSNCALVQQPLYLQRADGQGYSSQQSRAIEQVRSLVEIKKRLLNHPALSVEQRTAISRSSHRDLLGLAWQLMGNRQYSEVDSTLKEAKRYGCTVEWLKMTIRSRITAFRVRL